MTNASALRDIRQMVSDENDLTSKTYYLQKRQHDAIEFAVK